MASKVSSVSLRRMSSVSKLLIPASTKLIRPQMLVPKTGSLVSKPSFMSTSSILRKELSNEGDVENKDGEDIKEDEDRDWMNSFTGDPKDRSREIPLELSMAYVESEAYRQTYGNYRVWELYRRNFTKGLKFVETRRTCIRGDTITTGNPCPICRDEYLVVDYRNLKLITQFIDEYSGYVFTSKKTGVCQKQYKNIRIAIDKARLLGLLQVDQPFIEYDYSKYNR